MSIPAGAADQFANVTILNTDGTAKTDVIHSTPGLAIKYQRNNGSVVTLVAASMLAGGAHVDGGFYHVGDGSYKIGLPDAAVSAVGLLRVWTELADSKSIADSIRLVAFDPDDASTIGPTPLQVWEQDVSSVTGGSQAGGILEAINGEVAALENLSPADVRTEVDAGLTAYDGPTKAELDGGLAALTTPSQVRTEVDAGLAAYDSPTKAELDAAVAPLALEASVLTVASYVDTEVSAIQVAIASVQSVVDDLPATEDVGDQVAAKLAEYDGPTKAELDAAVAPLALEASVQQRLALSAQETTNLQHFLSVTTPNKTMNDCGVAGSGLTAEEVWQFGIAGFTTEGQAGTVLLAAAAGGTGSAGEGTSFATTDIQNAALQPKSAEADGVKMEARSIDEMIKADEYARKNEAAKRPLGGIRITRTQSGGSTGRT